MTTTQGLITAAAIAGIVLVIILFINLINKERVRLNKLTGQPYCKSCVHSHCSCGLLFPPQTSKGSGRSGQVPGESTEETDRKTLNV